MQYILQQLPYPRTSSTARIVAFDETLVGLRKKVALKARKQRETIKNLITQMHLIAAAAPGLAEGAHTALSQLCSATRIIALPEQCCSLYRPL
jgi:hypothetical protein